MQRQKGFTLIELLIVVAILGVLASTAVPLYRILQQRTYGREAVIVAKQVLDAQVMYYLEHNKFWPEDGRSIAIYHNTPGTDSQIDEVKNALKVTIPVGHYLDFFLSAENVTAEDPVRPRVYLTISSHGNFAIFSGGSDPYQFQAQVDRTGRFYYVIPE